MAVLNVANLKKSIYYLQRNGVKNTWNAARERMGQAQNEHYEWEEPSLLQIREGREYCQKMIQDAEAKGGGAVTFSILVPAYRTDPVFLRELAESVREQTYPCWELLILDASEDDAVRDALREFCDREGISLTEGKEDTGWQSGRIRYVRLPENKGISENTNAGLSYAAGDYIGFLDHDDVLTPDALEYMAEAVLQSGEEAKPKLLYSDEDKWNGEEGGYYEPNFKEDFNLDLLLSNNYICHFLVLEAELFRQLKLRGEYDGAQDYDLVLRAAERILQEKGNAGDGCMAHIPRVLYHWRCHRASTAENPRSKTYAYEAGRRALQDYADRQGISARAVNLKHVGFYRLDYGDPKNGGKTGGAGPRRILENRPDVAAVGGRVSADKNYQQSPDEKNFYPDSTVQKGSLVGGRMDQEGRVFYYGLKSGYSGYLHRAVLTQDAEAVDIRRVCVAKEYQGLFEETVGVPYVTESGGEWFDSATLPADADVRELSLALGRALREQGKRILWDPQTGME